MRKISLFLMMAADGVGGGAGPGANRPGTGPGASQKYNQAVAKATGTGVVDTGRKAVPLGNTAAMFSKFEPADLEAMASSGKYEFAPQMMALEPGQKIEGILEGYGPGNDFENPETNEIRHVDSWIIASMDGSLRVSILSSKQLDSKLPPFIGLPVVIARNPDIKLAGGHRCGDYHVGGPRLANGTPRKWGWVPAIEAAPAIAALPAGAVDANPTTSATPTNGVAPAQA